MVKLIRSAQIKNGKMQEGIQLAKELTEYINTHHRKMRTPADNKWQVEVWMEVGNKVGRIHWTVLSADLAEFNKLQETLLADKRFQTLIERTGDVYVEGSVSDVLMTSLK